MIYLGADHGGFELKEKIKKWLDEWGEAYEDLGAHELNPGDDYTVYAHNVAAKVDRESDRSQPWPEQAKGILLCRSGGGMLIVANRYHQIRGDYVFNEASAAHGRDDNDCNVISLAGDWVSDDQAKLAVRAWLDTPFSGEERHIRRVNDINNFRNS